MPAAKPTSLNHPARLPRLVLVAAVVLGLGLSLLGADATAQTRATLVPAPEEASNTILVLDYSNSRWGQIDGVPKIGIARDIIERNLAEWTQSTRLGLVAYGHRRKSDCDDIELIAAPAEQTTDAMLAFLADAAPRGRTPLSSALEQAASHAHEEGLSASLVLLTDGIESCGRDPCAAVTDLDGPEAEELRCIADITGGRFLTADDAEALDAALVDTLARPAGVVLPSPRSAEDVSVAAPVPTTAETHKNLLVELASMREEIAALEGQMDERERSLLSAQAALSEKLADLTTQLNRSRLAGDRLRAENEQLQAAIRSLLDLSDQAAALAGDVLAPRRETQAASRMTRAVWKPTSPLSRLKVVRDLA